MKNFNSLMILISSLIIYADFLPRKILADDHPVYSRKLCNAVINYAIAGDRIEQTCKQYHRGYMNETHAKSSLNETLNSEVLKLYPKAQESMKAEAIKEYYSCSNIMPK